MSKRKKKLLTVQHALISTVCNSVNVRSDFVTSFANIHFYHCLCVDWESFVGIDCHTKQPRIGLKYKNVVKKIAKIWVVHHISSLKTNPNYTSELVYMLGLFVKIRLVHVAWYDILECYFWIIVQYFGMKIK